MSHLSFQPPKITPETCHNHLAPAQLLGLTDAAKVTLGQTAETMRDTQHKDKMA